MQKQVQDISGNFQCSCGTGDSLSKHYSSMRCKLILELAFTSFLATQWMTICKERYQSAEAKVSDGTGLQPGYLPLHLDCVCKLVYLPSESELASKLQEQLFLEVQHQFENFFL